MLPLCRKFLASVGSGPEGGRWSQSPWFQGQLAALCLSFLTCHVGGPPGVAGVLDGWDGGARKLGASGGGVARGWGSVRTGRGLLRREAVVVGNEVVNPVFTAREHRGLCVGCLGHCRKKSKRCPRGVWHPRGGSWKGYGARVTGVETRPQQEAWLSARTSRMTDGTIRH